MKLKLHNLPPILYHQQVDCATVDVASVPSQTLPLIPFKLIFATKKNYVHYFMEIN